MLYKECLWFIMNVEWHMRMTLIGKRYWMSTIIKENDTCWEDDNYYNKKINQYENDMYIMS